jgi:hypothetical protein
MKIITELFDTLDFIEEDTTKGKQYYIKGITLQEEVKNRNGRIYPSAVLTKEVNRYIKEKVNNNCGFGELNHPEKGPTVDLKQVSHRFVEIVKEGKNWISKALITDTPNGNIVKGLQASGGRLGISSRGMGTLVATQEAVVVQPDFHLVTAGDIVSDPSGPECWIAGIMENIEFFYDETKGYYIPEISERNKYKIKRMTRNQIEENALKMFEQYLKDINNVN